MSLTSEERGAGVGASSALGQAPRLRSGGDYATWRPAMDVYLQKAGAEGVHQESSTAAQWKAMDDGARAWAREALADAMSGLSLGVSASSSSSGGSTPAVKKVALSDDVKEYRKVIKAVVERSRRAHDIIYSALPDDLCPLVAQLPQRWAFGLWDWLEKKFQPTEKDNVHGLLSQWFTMHQAVDESFDEYRARVNHLQSLLKLAKPKDSDMYAFHLYGHSMLLYHS